MYGVPLPNCSQRPDHEPLRAPNRGHETLSHEQHVREGSRLMRSQSLRYEMAGAELGRPGVSVSLDVYGQHFSLNVVWADV